MDLKVSSLTLTPDIELTRELWNRAIWNWLLLKNIVLKNCRELLEKSVKRTRQNTSLNTSHKLSTLTPVINTMLMEVLAITGKTG
jgi:hypothetical protein